MENNNGYEMFKEVPDIMTPVELQKVLKIGRSTVYALIRDGSITSIRIKNLIRIRKPDLIDFVMNINDSSTDAISA